ERAVRLDRVNKINAIIGKLDLFVSGEKKSFLAWVETSGSATPAQRASIAQYDRMRRERLIQQKVEARMRLDALKLQDGQYQKEGPYVRQAEIFDELSKRTEVKDLKAKIEARNRLLDERVRIVGMDKDHPKMREEREAVDK